MRAFIKPTHMPGYGGWGNGYVVIPKGNPLHGLHYDKINVEVHYGLTFSEPASELSEWPEILPEDKDGWVVGFDTLHSGDTEYKWPEFAVMDEANRLKEQLENTPIETLLHNPYEND